MPTLAEMVTIVKKRSVETTLSLDYPRRHERIMSSEYSFRISAPTNVLNVSVAIDQGPWQACRQAVGYWWYDWSGYEDGEHEIIARAEMEDDRQINSAPHAFLVGAPVKSF